jgi:hypothetical protein
LLSVPEYVQQISLATLPFVVVFALNVAPALAPPTWVTLSFIGFSMPDTPVAALALLGATAATLGRIALAKLSRTIVRAKLLDERTRQSSAPSGKRYSAGLVLYFAIPAGRHAITVFYKLARKGSKTPALPC